MKVYLINLVNKILSIKKDKLILISILILGFILRLMAAINLSVAADDMHHTLHAVNFLNSGKLVLYDQSSGLWHSFTSIMYNIFGISQLSSRIATLLFGTISILVIFLLSREFFSKRTSLFAALLLAISPFHIKGTIAEMDVMAMFFVLTSMYLFVKAMKSDEIYLFVISSIFLGLAIYTKVYPILFFPSVLLYALYYCKKNDNKVLTGKNIKKLLIFSFFIFLFFIPSITHNYLLYKDKGFLDLIYTSTTGIGKENSAQYYAWDSFFDSKASWKGLLFGDSRHIASGTPLLWGAINYIRIGDPLGFYLGLIGIPLLLFTRKRPKDYIYFFFLTIIPLLIFLATRNLLPKHYLFLDVLIIPLGAITLNWIDAKTSRFSKIKTSKAIVIILLIFSLFYLGLAGKATMTHFYSKSHIAQAIEFKNKNIPQNSLIVVDSRMYRGRVHWISAGYPYLEGTDFINILNQQEQFDTSPQTIDVYYFECVIDDCGWGTVKDQPEFNQSMESLTDLFKKNGKLLKTIEESNLEQAYFPLMNDKKIEYTRIYHLQIPLKGPIIEISLQPKIWFLYPIGFEPIEQNFDYFKTRNPLDSLLYNLARFIIWIAVILTFLSPMYIIYIIFNNENNNNNSSL